MDYYYTFTTLQLGTGLCGRRGRRAYSAVKFDFLYIIFSRNLFKCILEMIYIFPYCI